MMKWYNKIVYCDKSLSKISTRSLSKFKKLDIASQNIKQQSNSLLQKSQLRLKSFQKTQSQHRNSHSFYLDKSKLEQMNQSRLDSDWNKDSRKNLFQNILTEEKSQFFKQSIKNKKQKRQNSSKNNFIIQEDNIEKNEFQLLLNEKNRHSNLIKTVYNIKLMVKEFKSMIKNFSIQLNRIIQKSIEQIKADLIIFLKQQTMKLQLSVEQLNTTLGKPLKTKRTTIQDTTYMNQQISIKNDLKQNHKHGPVKFKNKFKNVVNNAKEQQNFQPQSKNYNKKKEDQNEICNKILTRSPARKRSKSRTYQRVNSLMFDSCCESQNGKYIKREVDKSGSKSIRKIQQRLISMRKILTKENQQIKIINKQDSFNPVAD